MNREKEKGSILVLTIIAVLILSIMVTGLLNVGTTEIYTTQNFHLNKAAYYEAVEGVEKIRDKIFNNPDPEYVQNDIPVEINNDIPPEAYTDSADYLSYHSTGTLKDMEQMGLAGAGAGIGGEVVITEPPKIDQYKSMQAPPPPSFSLGAGSGGSPIEFVIWKVQVTSTVRVNKRSTYSEVISGIYSFVTTGYN